VLSARQNVAIGHDKELMGWAASIAVDGADHGEGIVLVVVDLCEVVVVVVVRVAALGAFWLHPAATVNTTITASDDEERRRKVVVVGTRRHSSMAIAFSRAGCPTAHGRLIGHFDHFCDNNRTGAGKTRVRGADGDNGDGKFVLCTRWATGPSARTI